MEPQVSLWADLVLSDTPEYQCLGLVISADTLLVAVTCIVLYVRLIS